MTIIYSVYSNELGDDVWVTSLKEARDIAKKDDTATITKITLAKMPLRELLCAVANRRGYADEQENVK